jgi:glycosyltransferase involved in cell wall biosynthesis
MTSATDESDAAPAARRLHVVMCAGACHPDFGSEFAVGWQWITAAAQRHRVTVVAGDAHGTAEAVQRRLKADPELARNVTFRFLPWFDPPASKLLESLWVAVPPIYYRYYRRWLRLAADEVARVIAEDPADIVHHVTYICYREPGAAWRLGVSYVWGPIGGTQNVPWAFLPSLGLYHGCRHAARNVLNWIDLHCRRDVAAAMNTAACLSAVASDTQKEIRRLFHRSSVVIPATSCESGVAKTSEASDAATKPVRFVFSGLHIARKGLPYALEALGRLRDLPWSLDVLGSGPLTEAWRRHAVRLRIDERVTFHGFLPRADAVRVMANADAFVFPSLQEGWPTVVIEALSLGLPVLTPRHHGMADMIDDECGFPLRIDRPSNLLEDLTIALRTLASDRGVLRRLSAGAVRRAALFSRERQVDAIDELYRQAVSSRKVERA